MSRANTSAKILRAAHRRMERSIEIERQTGQRTRMYFDPRTKANCEGGAINGQHLHKCDSARTLAARREAHDIVEDVYYDMLMELPADDPRVAKPSFTIPVNNPLVKIMRIREGIYPRRYVSIPTFHDYFWTADEILKASKLALIRAEALDAERKAERRAL